MSRDFGVFLCGQNIKIDYVGERATNYRYSNY